MDARSLAMLQWVLTFVLVGPLCAVSMLLLFRSNWWWLSLLYGAWFYYDGEACRRGGRRFECVRRWRLWRLMAEYFPVRLHKTCELDASENFLLGFHPHGVFGVGAFVNFATEATGFSELFPGITPYLSILEGHFHFPLYRDYLMSSGAISVRKPSLQFVLGRGAKGRLVCVLPGGANEALDSHPGPEHVVHLTQKMGLVRLALETGSHLVPCFSFGETQLYDQVGNKPGSPLRSIQNLLTRIFGFSPPIFYAHGPLPFSRQINTVVGAPIRVERKADPTDSEVQQLLSRYISDLQLLFDAHKAKFAGSDATLRIV